MLSILDSIQRMLQNTLGATFAILVWSLLLSAFSMTIYWLVSPQNRLKRLKTDLEVVREQLKDHVLMEEKPFSVISRLLSLSFQRVLFSFLPALLATIPVIFIWDFLSSQYDVGENTQEFITIGPWWLRGWWTIFIVGMVSFSIAIKSLFRIE